MINLSNIISFSDFTWHNNTFQEEEKTLLEPQLTKLGYWDFEWGMGDVDSFGPLVRTVTMRDQKGKLVHGFYG